MSRFSEARARQIDVVFATFGDEGSWTKSDGSASADLVRIVLRRPGELDQLERAGFVREKPYARIPVADVADLRKGDVLDLAGDRWLIAEAPTRPGDGMIWMSAVQNLGAA